jgi:hypothetical protein
MPLSGEPDAVKVARPVRRGESRNLHIAGGIVVRHPESKQGARLLPNTARSGVPARPAPWALRRSRSARVRPPTPRAPALRKLRRLRPSQKRPAPGPKKLSISLPPKATRCSFSLSPGGAIATPKRSPPTLRAFGRNELGRAARRQPADPQGVRGRSTGGLTPLARTAGVQPVYRRRRQILPPRCDFRRPAGPSSSCHRTCLR